MSTFVSYAQNFEDVILFRALGDVANGFYVDVGAQHPLRDSVTRAFYERGWRGVNIEPVAEWNGLLKVDRPEDVNLSVAIGASEGTVLFYEVRQTGLSTTDREIAAKHVLEGFDVTTYRVPMVTLDSVLAEHGMSEIHFLKVDVEGGEQAVLRGISLDRYRPWIVVVEATLPNSQSDVSAQWEPILLEAGYRMVYGDGLNRFYLANEHAELESHFNYPPNFFDNFVRHADWERAEDARRFAEQNTQLQSELENAEDRAHIAEERMRSMGARLREADSKSRGLVAEVAARATDCTAREQRIVELEEELAQMKNSRSWRVTKPLRYASSLLGAARVSPIAPRVVAEPRPEAGEAMPVSSSSKPATGARVPDEARLLELARSAGNQPLPKAPRKYVMTHGRLEALLAELQSLSYPPQGLPARLDKLPGANLIKSPVLRFYERLFRKQSMINARLTEALKILLDNQRNN